MKNTRILIMSTFLAINALTHLQGMNQAPKDIPATTKNTAQNQGGGKLPSQNNPATVPNQPPVVQKALQPDKQNPHTKRQKIDAPTKYNEMSAHFVTQLREHQADEENLSMDNFEKQISELKTLASDLIKMRRNIPCNTPVTRVDHSDDLKNLESIIKFISINRTTPRLSSLEAMRFTNWWTTIINFVNDDQKIKDVREVYMIAAITLSIFAAITSGYLF